MLLFTMLVSFAVTSAALGHWCVASVAGGVVVLAVCRTLREVTAD